jgi:hypothetical protein
MPTGERNSLPVDPRDIVNIVSRLHLIVHLGFADFTDLQALETAVGAFIDEWNEIAPPFHWAPRIPSRNATSVR